ncbi:Binding-protein-dependent transport systems inner membrane component [Thermobacillus xylanilyticus]|jgi:putative aldouronate transport system permease protein|uniref:Binding-protein-dependent transport systems inner membrane component n=1 Tax=Thermobacillus xylanilyticus TaxID=76633 RepID=A0ABN7RRA8_THEXY|nr:carbohydrate ABC transporter permease [Thermobacillus xylanilyticus]CAG5084188.1 Binding-protein-dependent transport systems inner membrane component [Thermobacillus xylanilyticus]
MEAAVNAKPKAKLSGANPKNILPAWAQWSVNIVFILYSLLCIIPIVLLVMVSFSSEDVVMREGYKFIPSVFDTSAYDFLFEDFRQVARSYGITVSVTVIGTVLSMVMVAMYAYPISRRDFPHARFFTFIVFFTMLFGGGLVPWYLVYVQLLHLKDTLWVLIMPLLIPAFWVLVTRTFFATSVPSAVLESARIDGAGEVRIFFQIVMPLSLPVLATVALFQTITYWNDWFLSLVYITKNENVSIQYLMYKTMQNVQYLAQNSQAMQALQQAGAYVRFPAETMRMAMAVVGIGPIVLAYPFFQKYFIKGLTVGAVKG